jgi:hypothetical protein
MPCPFFLPALAAPEFGDPPDGDCLAEPGRALSNDWRTRLCTRGYARLECPLAAGASADAYQFLIQSHAAGVFRVAWSSERDHGPLAVGVLEIRETDPCDSPLERQARAVVHAYLARTRGVW